MKKILILANNDVGLYKFRKELIAKLLEEHEVFISLPYGESVDKLVDMGCVFIETNVDRRGMNPIKDLKLLKTYLLMLKSVKPNMVITYTIKPNIYGGIACRFKKIKYASNITGLGTAFQYDNVLRKVIIKLYQFALKKVAVVFFENEGNKSSFVNSGIIKDTKAVKLNGAGVNIEEYPLCDYPSQVEGLRFLFIGRVMKEKGIEELFYSAKKIKEEYPDISFDVVGPFEDDYKEQTEELVSKKIINYYGYQEDVQKFIKNSHCVILPSYHEGMSNVLLEAGAMGRPLITSNIHGCMEAVIDTETGFLVEVKSKTNLVEKIKKFHQLEYLEKVLMGKRSRVLIENKFSKRVVVDQTIKEISSE